MAYLVIAKDYWDLGFIDLVEIMVTVEIIGVIHRGLDEIVLHLYHQVLQQLNYLESSLFCVYLVKRYMFPN